MGAAELSLMMELIGSCRNPDPGSKFNLQLFPGLKGGGHLPTRRIGGPVGFGLPSISRGCVPCQHYVIAYLL